MYLHPESLSGRAFKLHNQYAYDLKWQVKSLVIIWLKVVNTAIFTCVLEVICITILSDWLKTTNPTLKSTIIR